MVTVCMQADSIQRFLSSALFPTQWHHHHLSMLPPRPQTENIDGKCSSKMYNDNHNNNNYYTNVLKWKDNDCARGSGRSLLSGEGSRSVKVLSRVPLPVCRRVVLRAFFDHLSLGVWSRAALAFFLGLLPALDLASSCFLSLLSLCSSWHWCRCFPFKTLHFFAESPTATKVNANQDQYWCLQKPSNSCNTIVLLL